MKPADLLAAARRILWQTWAGTGEEVGSAGAQALIDAGMLVPPGGAAELERLRLLLDAQPVELSEQQLGALIAAGNGALSDYHHERACACSEYPAGCATNPAYRREVGYWDTDAFALGMGAVLGVWESIRRDATAVELLSLRERVARYRTAWQRARTRALSTGGAADRYAARAAELQAALQDMLGTALAVQAERDALRTQVAQLQADMSVDSRALLNVKRPASEAPTPSRGASEIKHPVMRPTREHLAKHPMPEQQRKDGAA